MNLLSARTRKLSFCIIFFSLLLLFMLFHFPAGLLAEEAEKEHTAGLRPLSPEEWEEIEPRIFRITEPQNIRPMDNLPAQVKNTEHLPVVRSQGQMGTCAAFATAYYYKTYQEARERGWQNPDPETHPERVASPTWAYNLAPRGGYSIGVNHWQVAQQICDYGIANWDEMWYDPNNYDHSEWPTEEIWRRAAEWRGEQVGAIAHNTPEGLEALKEHLAGGDLAVVGVPVYSNFDAYPGGQYTYNSVFYNNHTIEDDDDGGYRGGHALTVVGYDDEMEYYDAVAEEYKQGALLLVNSWGTNWGVSEPDVGSDVYLGTRGFIWIAYDYFLDNIDDWEGHSDALIMTDRIDYQPEKFALIGIDHTNGRQLFIDVKGGEYDEPLWDRPGLPHGNPGELYVEEHGYIAVDLTDYTDYEPLSYYLAVRQVKAQWGVQLGGEGDITYFAIQEGDEPPFIVSPDVPVSTELGDNDPYRDFAVRAGLFNDTSITFDDLKLRRGGIAWADFTGNGYPDLLASGHKPDGEAILSGDNFTGIFPNRGDGTFDTALTAGLPQLSMSLVAAADYNNNGYPDIALNGRKDGFQNRHAGIYRNNGDNAFTQLNASLPDNILSLTWVDTNNNGRADLVVGTTEKFLIYENRGGDSFVPLPPLFEAAWYDGEEYEGRLNLTTAWGDYDGNGLADLAVVGEYICGPYHDRTRIPISTVLKNQGNGTFKDMEVDLPVLNGASAAWGDYNKNGLLDLAVSGFLDIPRDPMVGITAVYRNNGDGTFTDIEASLGQAWNGAVAWGDINNNGWLDLVVTGQNDYTYSNTRLFLPDHIFVSLWPYPEHIYDHQAKVFLNDRQGSFMDAGGGLPRVSISNDYNPGYRQTAYNNTLALVDYELNGDLDLFLSGTQTILFEYLPEWLYTGIYRNEAAAVSPNTSPEPPGGLNTLEEETPGTVTLQWNVGSDAETPEDGLYYNIRVGTSPGAGDIISGVNAHITPGRAVLPGLNYTLSGLPSGTYHWSVQTLDAGYAASEWSPEQSFSVVGLGDVNGNGSVTVADAIIVLRHVVGLVDIGEDIGPDALIRADVTNTGGEITVADAIFILRIIVGFNPLYIT